MRNHCLFCHRARSGRTEEELCLDSPTTGRYHFWQLGDSPARVTRRGGGVEITRESLVERVLDVIERVTP